MSKQTPVTMCLDKIRRDEVELTKILNTRIEDQETLDELESKVSRLTEDELRWIDVRFRSQHDQYVKTVVGTRIWELPDPDCQDSLPAVSFVGNQAEHSPAEFERQLGLLSDERLLEEATKFSKAGLDGFETACLVDELCHRLKRRIEA